MNLHFNTICVTMLAALSFGVTSYAHRNADATHHAIIEFNKGQDQLTEASKTKLNHLIDTVKQTGQIASVEVAVWSDEAYPARNSNLTEMDRDLANNRGDQIESYLKDDLLVPNVETFNMAEGSNWLSKAFNTKTAELKSVFSKEAAPSMSREDFNIIKANGAPSKAIVVIQMEDKSTLTQPLETKDLAPY